MAVGWIREEVLTPQQALALIQAEQAGRTTPEHVLDQGYPGYDTSVGWFHYSDEQITVNARRAVAAGFRAIKLKVGRPIRHAMCGGPSWCAR
ncbi:MAG: hypothetical protein ABIV47_14760 [Roseiflexaceae bacterium]